MCVAEAAKCDVVDGEETGDEGDADELLVYFVSMTVLSSEQGHGTYDRFHADGLDEAVEDLGEHACAETRAAHLVGIAVHAAFPVVADRFHGWDTAGALAAVFAEFVGTGGHFCEDLGGFLQSFLVDVIADGTEDTPDDVH